MDRVAKLISQFLPHFMYASAYDRMDGAIQIEQTQARIQNEEIKINTAGQSCFWIFWTLQVYHWIL